MYAGEIGDPTTAESKELINDMKFNFGSSSLCVLAAVDKRAAEWPTTMHFIIFDDDGDADFVGSECIVKALTAKGFSAGPQAGALVCPRAGQCAAAAWSRMHGRGWSRSCCSGFYLVRPVPYSVLRGCAGRAWTRCRPPRKIVKW